MFKPTDSFVRFLLQCYLF